MHWFSACSKRFDETSRQGTLEVVLIQHEAASDQAPWQLRAFGVGDSPDVLTFKERT